MWAVLILLATVACSDGEEPAPTASPEPSAAQAPPVPTAEATATPTPQIEPARAPSPTPRPTPAPFVPKRITTPTPTPEAESVSQAALARTWSFNEAPCRFAGLWDSLGADPPPPSECGYLTVPEDRTRGDGRTLRLHVAVFKTDAEDPAPDPIVYLEGGPGGHALASATLGFDETFGPYLKNRDFIIFDQRGTGFSEPALECPESIAASNERRTQNLTVEEEIKAAVEAINACRDRLVGAGVNLAAYSTRESAADLNALREALGYEEWNLFGTSYGTKLALTAMRDFPDGIRSVILDSTHPLEVDFYSSIPGNADDAFELFFESCASDSECGVAFPELGATFYGVVDSLNQDPIDTTIVNPLTGEAIDIVVTGDELVDFLFQALYFTELIPLLPEIVYDAKVGNVRSMSVVLGLFLASDEFLSLGMHLSLRCGEEVTFTSSERVAAHLEPYRRLRGFIQRNPIFEVCPTWGAKEAAPIENLPVISGVPTLVLAGEFDPITPPEWGRLAAASLSNSYYFEFPGMGHGVSVAGDCPVSVALSFLDDPTAEPDSGCILEMGAPGYFTPVGELILEPISDESSLIEGVVPQGWAELQPEYYGRTDYGLVAILQQAIPGVSADQLLIGLSGQLGLTQIPDVAVTREAGGLLWRLYEIELEGETVDLALAEDDQTGYLVLLSAGEGRRDAYYHSVFLAAIDALRPK